MKSRAPLVWFVIGLVCLACHAATGTESKGYSAAALYNAANAYARAGKPGLAVLNYERARLLTPGDPDVDANLRFVRESAHVPAEPRRWIDSLVTVARPAVVASLGIAGLVMIGAGLLAGLLTSRHRRTRRAAMATGAVLVSFTAINAVLVLPRLHEAVILTAASPARATPVPMGDPLFVLPEAETVSITADHDDFVLIRTRAGRSGWVSRANLAPVVPSR
ncbi:MAG TPA: SH3 domain-containing protein [Steroidobacteraceae bacterium]|nr:SH3 domain-containing protein [Steroidobacteraceae bacterium]